MKTALSLDRVFYFFELSLDRVIAEFTERWHVFTADAGKGRSNDENTTP